MAILKVDQDNISSPHLQHNCALDMCFVYIMTFLMLETHDWTENKNVGYTL